MRIARYETRWAAQPLETAVVQCKNYREYSETSCELYCYLHLIISKPINKLSPEPSRVSQTVQT